MSTPHWSAEVSAHLDYILAHVPNNMLTAVVVGIGLAAAAVGVLALVSTTRDKDARYVPLRRPQDWDTLNSLPFVRPYVRWGTLKVAILH